MTFNHGVEGSNPFTPTQILIFVFLSFGAGVVVDGNPFWRRAMGRRATPKLIYNVAQIFDLHFV